LLKGDETWDRVQKFLAHEEGVNSIVWGPVIESEENNNVNLRVVKEFSIKLLRKIILTITSHCKDLSLLAQTVHSKFGNTTIVIFFKMKKNNIVLFYKEKSDLIYVRFWKDILIGFVMLHGVHQMDLHMTLLPHALKYINII